MTKNQLIEKVAKKSHLTKRASQDAVNAVFDVIKDNLSRGEKTIITGFGTFLVRSRAARRGRNPQTGEPIQIPGKKLPGFTAGKTIKRQIK
jgi:DNA-binding protein HU-beta